METIKTHGKPLRLYFILAFAFSWAVMIPLALRAQGLLKIPIPYSLHYAAAFGPMLSALIATAVYDGRDGVRELIGRMLKWKVRPFYWLAAISPILIYAVSALILALVGRRDYGFGFLGQVEYLTVNLGPWVILLWTLTFGIGEETGWRGFALPRLQRGRTPMKATIILWGIWALWHLPAFFYSYDLALLPGFLIGLLAGTITFTWMYNSTGGSILLVAVFHGLFDSTTACVGCKAGILAPVISVAVMMWAARLVFVSALKKSSTENPDEVSESQLGARLG